MDYKIGIYVRLSQSDTDLAKKEGKSESESISHQRALIKQYIMNDPELKQYASEEFFDDGFSGTNFNRPAFEKLLAKIKNGTINIVIVKDFSRFGRDYIELGDYLERIFPYLGIRFISVNDHYDSNNYKGTTGGLDVVLRNIVYDYYSKDLSAKVKSIKREQMRKGEYFSGRTPFGYTRNKYGEKKFEIDPPAAKIVRLIYDMALAGKSLLEIARWLNMNGIITPGKYDPSTGETSIKNLKQKAADLWTYGKVYSLLKKDCYYGALVGHKREVIKIGSDLIKLIPREEWFIAENKHEAIVTKEEWQKVESLLRKLSVSKNVSRRPVNNYALRGVIRCGHCKYKLEYRSNKANPNYYFCKTAKVSDKLGCCKEPYLEKDLDAVILRAITRMFKIAEKCFDTLEHKKVPLADQNSKIKKEIIECQHKLRKIQSDKFSNMDKYMASEISKEQWQERKNEIDKLEIQVSSEIESLEQKLNKVDPNLHAEVDRAMKEIYKYKQEQTLSNDMVKSFIKNIYIFDSNTIEIEWNFSDTFLSMLNSENALI